MKNLMFSFAALLFIYIYCNAQRPENNEYNRNDSNNTSVNIVSEENAKLYAIQPSIEKIDIISNDTLVITSKYFYGKNYYKIFKYSNYSFQPLLNDDSSIIDFQKYNSGKILLVKKIENDKYLIYNQDKSYHQIISSKPRLINASYTPSYLIKNTLFILNDSTNKISKYNLGTVFKKCLKKYFCKNDLYKILENSYGTSAIYNNHFIISRDDGEFIGFVLDFDLNKNKVKLLRIGFVNTSLIINNSLYFIAGLAHMGIELGILYQYNNDFKTIIESTRIFRLNKENNYNLSSFDTGYYDKLTNSLIIGMYKGIIIIKNNEIKKTMNFNFDLKFPDYSAENRPTAIKRYGDNLFVGTNYGLYIFSYDSLKFIRRVVFSKDNLEWERALGILD